MAVLATFHTGKSFRVWCECPGNFRLILRSNIACASVNTRCFISWFQSNCCLQTSILNVVSAIFTWGSSIRDNNNNNKKTPLWSGMTGEGSDVYVTLNCLRRKQLSWSDNHLICHAGIFVGAIWEAWRWPCNISRLRGSDQSCNDGNSENDGTWGVMFNTRHPTCRNNLFYVAPGRFRLRRSNLRWTTPVREGILEWQDRGLEVGTHDTQLFAWKATVAGCPPLHSPYLRASLMFCLVCLTFILSRRHFFFFTRFQHRTNYHTRVPSLHFVRKEGLGRFNEYCKAIRRKKFIITFNGVVAGGHCKFDQKKKNDSTSPSARLHREEGSHISSRE